MITTIQSSYLVHILRHIIQIENFETINDIIHKNRKKKEEKMANNNSFYLYLNGKSIKLQAKPNKPRD